MVSISNLEPSKRRINKVDFRKYIRNEMVSENTSNESVNVEYMARPHDDNIYSSNISDDIKNQEYNAEPKSFELKLAINND